MRGLLTIFAIAVFAPGALACTCGPPPNPALAFASNSLIFRGTVTKRVDRANFLRRTWAHLQELIGAPEFTLEADAKSLGFLVEFEVQRVWRGTRERRIKLFTGRGNGDCGVPFEVGRQYLVYGRCDADGDCYTFFCGRTRPIEYAAEDLRYLASKR